MRVWAARVHGLSEWGREDAGSVRRGRLAAHGRYCQDRCGRVFVYNGPAEGADYYGWRGKCGARSDRGQD